MMTAQQASKAAEAYVKANYFVASDWDDPLAGCGRCGQNTEEIKLLSPKHIPGRRENPNYETCRACAIEWELNELYERGEADPDLEDEE